MIKMGERMVIGLVMVTLFAVIGIGAALYTKTQDGPVEEVAEEMIEDQIEMTLDLPPESMDGKIDLTPHSREDK